MQYTNKCEAYVQITPSYAQITHAAPASHEWRTDKLRRNYVQKLEIIYGHIVYKLHTKHTQTTCNKQTNVKLMFKLRQVTHKLRMQRQQATNDARSDYAEIMHRS